MLKIRNKHITSGLIILLLSLIIINIHKIITLKNNYEELSNQSYKKHLSDSIQVKSLCNNILLLSKNSNFKIKPDLKLTSENGKQLVLSDIPINKYKLVFRFNEFTCKGCIYKEMGNIQEVAKEIGRKNILIMGAYSNPRNLFLNKRINNLKLPVYNVELNAIKNTIEDQNAPYIFVVDEKWNVQNLFIPNSEVPSLSKTYFNDVAIKFNKH